MKVKILSDIFWEMSLDSGIRTNEHHPCMKAARTIADLESAAEIQPPHIAEAIDYRSLDRAA